MITTDAALYGAAHATLLLESTTTAPSTCSCGQELMGVYRQHCPRCGCCLD